MSTTHTLYRFYSEDELLYIGITSDPGRRFVDHQKSKSWWEQVSRSTMKHYSSRKELEAAERRAIKLEQPKYNGTHNNDTDVPNIKPSRPENVPLPVPQIHATVEDAAFACSTTPASNGTCADCGVVLMRVASNAERREAPLWDAADRVLIFNPHDDTCPVVLLDDTDIVSFVLLEAASEDEDEKQIRYEEIARCGSPAELGVLLAERLRKSPENYNADFVALDSLGTGYELPEIALKRVARAFLDSQRDKPRIEVSVRGPIVDMLERYATC